MKKLILFLLLLAPTGYALNQIKDVDVASNAAIQFSKLASLASGKVLAGNASNVATAVTPAGEVTMDNTGQFGLSTSAVVGKLLSGFASTTGTITAADSVLTAIEKNAGNLATKISTTLNSGQVNVGNASNVATAVTPSGDVTMDNTGQFVVGSSKISNSKLAQMSASTIKCNNTGGLASAIDCTVAQAKTLLAYAFSDITGSVANTQLPTPVSSSFTTTLDWSVLKNVDGLYYTTVSSNVTPSWTNVTAGQTVVIAVKNTGSFAYGWPTAAKWAGNVTPSLTSGAHTDVFTCKSYDGASAYCSAIQNY